MACEGRQEFRMLHQLPKVLTTFATISFSKLYQDIPLGLAYTKPIAAKSIAAKKLPQNRTLHRRLISQTMTYLSNSECASWDCDENCCSIWNRLAALSHQVRCTRVNPLKLQPFV